EVLIRKKLVDYIAMDIKAPKEDYSKVANASVDIGSIEQSIALIKKSAPDYEFRMTVVPTLHSAEDIQKIAQWLGSAKRFTLQQFRQKNTLDKRFEKITPYEPDVLRQFKAILEKHITTVEIVGI
ncbi:anaerobic ribonucleoside-triphosphate reductase activating protein, partial [Candidatus Woesearchaeota archaeon CG_4_10_14_0_8_um_filter_47_5]